jgi:hypothetical protein
VGVVGVPVVVVVGRVVVVCPGRVVSICALEGDDQIAAIAVTATTVTQALTSAYPTRDFVRPTGAVMLPVGLVPGQ